MSQYTYWVEGTTCRSCEILIENAWKKLPDVSHVHVNAVTGEARLTTPSQTKPDIKTLQRALKSSQYTVLTEKPLSPSRRPTTSELVKTFAIVLFVGYILSNLGFFKTTASFGAGASFGTVFLVGLIAASSSCIAVVGGLLLSSTATFNERYRSSRPLARLRPVVLFVSGRIIGYTMLGGLLGVIGTVLTPTPTITALITILAALYMITMGLEMLHIAPKWLKKLLPQVSSKKLSHSIMDADKQTHPVMPLMLGAATFFLPCGFTQALQLYALTTGSFTKSALLLLAFALGTAPALLALGYASSAVKGKLGQTFFRFSGALVIILGLWNIQNGLAIAGYSLSLPTFDNSAYAKNDATVTMDGKTQVVKMSVDYNGYHPNHFTVRAGLPVRWEIDGSNAAGCASVLISRDMKLQKLLQPGLNTFTFIPQGPGEIPFSCSMGMYRGSFTVTPNNS